MNGDKTQTLKLWQNWKTQIVTKLKNSDFDKTWIKTKFKLWKNLNCDKSQVVKKLKLWHHSNCERKKELKIKMWQNLNCDKIQEFKI